MNPPVTRKTIKLNDFRELIRVIKNTHKVKNLNFGKLTHDLRGAAHAFDLLVESLALETATNSNVHQLKKIEQLRRQAALNRHGIDHLCDYLESLHEQVRI